MRRILISSLGTSAYEETDYILQGKNVGRACYIQEMLLKTKLVEPDRILMLLTKEALDKYQEPMGLQEILQRAGFGEENVRVIIIDGFQQNNQEEVLWKLFSDISEEIQEEDEVSLDITYSMRFIPFLLLSVCDYLKVYKKICLAGIYYGKMVKEEKKVYLVNASEIGELQEWTHGVSEYNSAGSIERLQKLVYGKEDTDAMTARYTECIDYLSEVLDGIKLSRGKVTDSPYNSVAAAYQRYKESKQHIAESEKDEKLRSMVPLFEMLDQGVQSLDSEDPVDVGLGIASWSRKFGYYQQAYIALEESVITYITQLLDIDVNHHVLREKYVENIVTEAIQVLAGKSLVSAKTNILEIMEDEAKRSSDPSLQKIVAEKIYMEKFLWLVEEKKELLDIISVAKKSRNLLCHFGYNANNDQKQRNKAEKDFDKWYQEFVKYRSEYDMIF